MRRALTLPALLAATGTAVALTVAGVSAAGTGRAAAEPAAQVPGPVAQPARSTPVGEPAADTPGEPVAPEPGSGWAALDAAITRIPGYEHDRPARWSVTAAAHPWGQTAWPFDDVTVSRATPPSRLDDVVRHEWSHVLQDRAYGHDTAALERDLDRAFGGSGTAGAERAADCMARELGAVWTHYTSCPDPGQRARARQLLHGQRLWPPGQ